MLNHEMLSFWENYNSVNDMVTIAAIIQNLVIYTNNLVVTLPTRAHITIFAIPVYTLVPAGI